VSFTVTDVAVFLCNTSTQFLSVFSDVGNREFGCFGHRAEL